MLQCLVHYKIHAINICTLKSVIKKNTNSTTLERFPAKFSTKYILIPIHKINFRMFEMKVPGKVWRHEMY